MTIQESLEELRKNRASGIDRLSKERFNEIVQAINDGEAYIWDNLSQQHLKILGINLEDETIRTLPTFRKVFWPNIVIKE